LSLISEDAGMALPEIIDLMKLMSTESDPQRFQTVYRERIRKLVPYDGLLSLSRRDLSAPEFRITRSHLFKEVINPWTQKDRLPLLRGGLLAELLYSDEPRIISNLKVDPSDPAYEHLKGFGSLQAIPHYDNGVGLNMVVSLRTDPNGYDPRQLPSFVWLSNLFGRATKSMVMARELRSAYERIDRELKIVAEIQRSLLPAVLPDVPGLQLAAHYQTSQQAGGDYYDLFPLPDGRLGMLIADVSGHGTPAAVLMAITHTVAHSFPGLPDSPGKVLRHLNARLSESYARTPGGFVTAFYGVYDPVTHDLEFSAAGHNPPRVRRGGPGGEILQIDSARDLPLGIADDIEYEQGRLTLESGDLMLLYTDGITEARRPEGGPMFGEGRLDDVLRAAPTDAGWTVSTLVEAVDAFTHRAPPNDDRTLVAAAVR
jgi:phosphoserine phosphatase RsbU/P